MQVIRMLAAAALVLTASTAMAQGGPGGGQGAGQGMGQRQNAMLFKDITLTEAQQAKVDSIQAAGRAEMQAMMQGGGMQDPATREKMMAARTKQMDAVRAVLTAEQQVIFDKNRAAMPQRGPGGRPPV